MHVDIKPSPWWLKMWTLLGISGRTEDRHENRNKSEENDEDGGQYSDLILEMPETLLGKACSQTGGRVSFRHQAGTPQRVKR